MAKKRSREVDEQHPQPAENQKDNSGSEDDNLDDDDFDMVNVDFEWFNFDAEIDFHGVKTLLRQLLDVDATNFDLSALTDLILAQHTIGSTVKVDGKGNDAYAFLTVLNLRLHHGQPAVAQLVEYLASQARASSSLGQVADVLAVSSGAQVGVVLAERLINMPSQIVPPMYTMLVNEIQAAVEDGEAYEFSHYLLVSKTYHEVESTLDVEKQKKKKAREEAPLFYFHPEDEIWQKHALVFGTYAYRNEETVADSKRAFQEMGVKSQGFMLLIEASKFPNAVKAVQEYLGAPS